MTFLPLEAPSVRLREIALDDADDLHRIYGDPLATRHLSFAPRSRDEVTVLVEGIVKRRDEQVPREEYALAVERRDTGEMVGVARLAVEENSSGQIGFAIRPDHWRRGHGREVVGLLLELGFEHLGLHRLWGARAPLNEASRRLMASAGMIEDGRIRDHVRTPDGWRDSVVHSILEHEWRARRGSR